MTNENIVKSFKTLYNARQYANKAWKKTGYRPAIYYHFDNKYYQIVVSKKFDEKMKGN